MQIVLGYNWVKVWTGSLEARVLANTRLEKEWMSVCKRKTGWNSNEQKVGSWTNVGYNLWVGTLPHSVLANIYFSLQAGVQQWSSKVCGFFTTFAASNAVCAGNNINIFETFSFLEFVVCYILWKMNEQTLLKHWTSTKSMLNWCKCSPQLTSKID